MAKIFFHSNIRFLRERKQMSQEDLSARLDISRNKLQALESGRTVNPAVGDLVGFSEHFKISVDSLLKIDLARLSELKLRELEAGNDVYTSGTRIRVLAISTDKENTENVEYVPVKAKMGYKAGYNDPEYIAALPKFTLPNLPRGKTYRIFTGIGESMLPIKPNTDFITEYVENWEILKDAPCVLILKSEGADFLFKYASWQKKERNFLLRSLNEEEYPPFTVAADEVLEVWKYHKHITDELPQKEPSLRQIMNMIKDLKRETVK